MIRIKRGFTIIEVALFLAITGLLFLGVTIGVQNSIFQQRYNDAVQNFAEFLRNAYAKTENVQGLASGGNSGKAIYGKLITFGESTDLTGNANDKNAVFVYDVIGPAECAITSTATLEALATCGGAGVDVIAKEGDKAEFLGVAESYVPKWSAVIQTTNLEIAEPFRGAILITRHPRSGTIYTFVYKMTDNKTIEVNKAIKDNRSEILKPLLKMNPAVFSNERIDFCINPNGNEIGGVRADVRIKKGARNASAIEVMTDSGNDCMGGD